MHTSTYVSMRQHTSAYVSIRQQLIEGERAAGSNAAMQEVLCCADVCWRMLTYADVCCSWFKLGCAAMREEEWECAVNAFHRVVNLGARFTCFTSTKVQILTRSGVCYNAFHRVVNLGARCTCFTSTKVRILKQKALIEPESYESWGNIGVCWRMLAYADVC
jgi:hypothetical protein